MHGPKTKMF